MRRAKEILPGVLFQGSHPAKWPAGRDEWLKENIDLVVVLAKRDPEIYVEGVEVWHIPVVDSHKTVDSRIPDSVVPVVLNWIRSGKRVLVCCLAGRSRSGACNVLVVRELKNLTGSEALDFVREKRPKAVKREGPEAYLRALPAPNPELHVDKETAAQIDALDVLEVAEGPGAGALAEALA